ILPHPPTPQFYTLSLHDALPISSTTSPATRSTSPHVAGGKVGLGCQGNPLIAFSSRESQRCPPRNRPCTKYPSWAYHDAGSCRRSEEHTSELQSRFDLVCRLLLE